MWGWRDGTEAADLLRAAEGGLRANRGDNGDVAFVGLGGTVKRRCLMKIIYH
jgi:hypothetical protein